MLSAHGDADDVAAAIESELAESAAAGELTVAEYDRTLTFLSPNWIVQLPSARLVVGGGGGGAPRVVQIASIAQYHTATIERFEGDNTRVDVVALAHRPRPAGPLFAVTRDDFARIEGTFLTRNTAQVRRGPPPPLPSPPPPHLFRRPPAGGDAGEPRRGLPRRVGRSRARSRRYAPPHGEEWPEWAAGRRADVRIAREGDGGGGCGCFCTPTFCGMPWQAVAVQAERAHDGAATRDDEIGRILGGSGTCPTCREIGVRTSTPRARRQDCAPIHLSRYGARDYLARRCATPLLPFASRRSSTSLIIRSAPAVPTFRQVERPSCSPYSGARVAPGVEQSLTHMPWPAAATRWSGVCRTAQEVSGGGDGSGGGGRVTHLQVAVDH